MDNTLMIIIGIFLAATLIFVVPLMSISERNDDIAQTVVQTATSEFVDKISISGVIKPSDYETYEQELSSTGNTYEIEIEVQHLDENFGKKNGTTSNDLIGENERYSTFTTEILDNMYNEDGTSQNYVLKKGDNVIVTVKNTNKTMAQTLRTFIYRVTGKGTYEIAANSSSMVVNNGGKTQNIQIGDSNVGTVQKASKWEQVGTQIYGKAEDGTTIITLEIGDYINYDCTNGGNTYTYTSPLSLNGYGDQTFTVQNNMRNIKWRVIGVDNNRLNIVSETSIDMLTLKGEVGATNGPSELNRISAIYGNGNAAVTAKSINTKDSINILRAFGKDDAKLNSYGDGNGIFGIYVTDNEETTELSWIQIQFTKCNSMLIDILFPEEQIEYLEGYWFADNYLYGEFGLYNTWGNSGFKNLYASNLDIINWPNGRAWGVRPVITLKTDLELKYAGPYNQCSNWNII